MKVNELLKYSFMLLVSNLGFTLKSTLKFLFWLREG